MEQLTVIYVWSNKVPQSKEISKILDNSQLANVVTCVCADCPEIRNALLFGRNPQTTVPAFIINRGGKFHSYGPSETHKALTIIKDLIDQVDGESDSLPFIDGLGPISSRSESSVVSRFDTDDEGGLLNSVNA